MSTIRRQAILIGAPGDTSNFLPGVEQDLKNYSAFLQSPFGGLWWESEISVLKNPSFTQLEQALKYTAVDFTFLMFAGHGHMQGSTTYAWINNNTKVSTLDLNTASRKQLVVVDACRKQIVQPTLDTIDLAEALAKMGRVVNKMACRHRYDEAVSVADIGRSTMYSCSNNESAGDTRAGGEFSRRLLEICEKWGESRSGYNPEVMSLPQAYQAVKAQMAAARVPQTPELENGRRVTSFPFAVG